MNRARLTAGCCSLLLVMIASCSSDDDAKIGPASDAATDVTAPPSSDGGATDAATGLACEAASLDDVTPVTPTAVNGMAPKATGGTLKDGRYVITKMTLYFPDDAATSVAPKTFQNVIDIAGAKIRRTASDSEAKTAFYSVGDFTIKGNSLETAIECSSEKDFEKRIQKVPFSVTDNGFETYTVSTYVLVNVYELR